jgi:hypothetical protein
MSDLNYWKGQLDRLQANPPKSHENFYNQSFVDRMNEAQKNIDGLVAEKDKSWAATQQAQNDYETFKGSVRRYSDVYEENKAKFGVEQKEYDYEKSKEALLQIDRTMKMLPSSINRNAEVRLSQAEREQAYNKQMDTYNKMMETQTTNSEVFKDVWNKAREAQTEATNREIGNQYSELNIKNNYWITKMNEFNAAEEKWRQARIEKQMIGSDYRMWQLNQQNAELYRYQQELSNALKRYSAAMETQIYQNEKNMEGHEKLQAYLKQQDQATKEKLADNVIGWYHQDTLGKNRKRLFDYNGSGGGGGGSW